MIIVTGASGQLGRAIVEQLLERVPATQIGASVRDPEKVADLAGRGVRVRKGDFAEPPSLAHAFEGASRLLLVSSNAQRYGDKIALRASLNLVPTLIGFDGQGNERWRIERGVNRMDLWRRLVSL